MPIIALALGGSVMLWSAAPSIAAAGASTNDEVTAATTKLELLHQRAMAKGNGVGDGAMLPPDTGAMPFRRNRRLNSRNSSRAAAVTRRPSRARSSCRSATVGRFTRSGWAHNLPISTRKQARLDDHTSPAEVTGNVPLGFGRAD